MGSGRLPLLCCVLGFALALALALSTGGHASVDTVQQLAEAWQGRAESMHPPLMSAFLSLAGGAHDAGFAPRALWAAVLLQGLLLWGGFALALAAPSAAGSVSRWRRGMACLLLLNPVLVVYTGIVWKDVLFAGLLLAAVACLLRAWSALTPRAVLGWAAAAVAVIVLLPQVRQQGIVLAPMLIVLPCIAVARAGGGGVVRRLGVLVVVGILAFAGARAFADASIRGAGNRAAELGWMHLMRFDLAGIEARVGRGPLWRLPLTPMQIAEVEARYSAERVDPLNQAEAYDGWARAHRGEALRGVWLAAIAEHPWAYARHRLEASAALLGCGDIRRCLPLHVGVEGLPRHLDVVALPAGTDALDRWLYAKLSPTFPWLFRHAAYAGLLLLVAGVAAAQWRRPGRRLLLSIAASLFAFIVVFTVTGIACDFRYLFPALPATTLLAVALLLDWSPLRSTGPSGEGGVGRPALQCAPSGSGGVPQGRP